MTDKPPPVEEPPEPVPLPPERDEPTPMQAHKIGPRIGNVKNDDPALIERIATG